ncbi:MAG: Holliday junction resolvase RuvX [Clostridiales bacterium]|nr:Holliday junction resolvase RuvX [Clostridiales bacterium]
MFKIMGLDVGDKTIGVAISDPLLYTAQGRTTIMRESIKKDIDQLIDFIISDNIKTIVVGFPKNMNNTVGPQAEKTLDFVKKLQKKIKYSERIEDCDIEVVMWDERLTSVAAERSMIEADLSRAKRKKIIDKMAAVYILQGYLDSRR